MPEPLKEWKNLGITAGDEESPVCIDFALSVEWGGSYLARVNYNGCVDLYHWDEDYPDGRELTAEAFDEADYCHTCDLGKLIEVLQALKAKAQEAHKGRGAWD